MTAGKVGPFPNQGLKYPKTAEKPPFQTWEEIEKQIKRGGLSEDQQSGLWDCVFLTLKDISELLKYVKGTAHQPFIYPMVVMAAHTGARRSELIRSLVNDFDNDTVLIQERKRTKGTRSTRRVPLTSLLKQVMGEWFKGHPGGQFTFCQQGQPITPRRSPRSLQADHQRLEVVEDPGLACAQALVHQQLRP